MKKISYFNRSKEEGGFILVSYAKLDLEVGEISIVEFVNDHIGVTNNLREFLYRREMNKELFNEKQKSFKAKKEKWESISEETYELQYNRFLNINR